MGKGASQGEESGLADSGWEGEVTAGVGLVSEKIDLNALFMTIRREIA